MIAVVEILVADGACAAGAFGDVLTGHFEMHPAGMGTFGGVHLEESAHLLENLVEWPRLVARGRRNGIAVHGIARPHHAAALTLDRAHERRQQVARLVGADPANEREAPGLVLRIEDLDEPHEFVGLLRRPGLEAERILDAATEFHMGMVGLPGAVADPDHVARAAIPVAGGRIDAGERLLEAEQQRLMAGEEIRQAQFRVQLRIDAAGAHEAERLGDVIGKLLVALRLRTVLDEAEHPLVRVGEVRIAAGGERAQ